jgi:hypothetical protein
MKSLPVGLTILATCALMFASPHIATGGSWKKAEDKPAPSTSDRITALHLASIAITVHATQTMKEYAVAPTTKITVNGAPATMSNLATGMDVVVTPEADGRTAAMIDAKSPQPPQKSEPPRKKPAWGKH